MKDEDVLAGDPDLATHPQLNASVPGGVGGGDNHNKLSGRAKLSMARKRLLDPKKEETVVRELLFQQDAASGRVRACAPPAAAHWLWPKPP